jgi:hypothetical protein
VTLSIVPLSDGHHRWGQLACEHPYLVILVSVILCGAACGGFGFYSMETDDELLWTPFGSPVSYILMYSINLGDSLRKVNGSIFIIFLFTNFRKY